MRASFSRPLSWKSMSASARRPRLCPSVTCVVVQLKVSLQCIRNQLEMLTRISGHANGVLQLPTPCRWFTWSAGRTRGRWCANGLHSAVEGARAHRPSHSAAGWRAPRAQASEKPGSGRSPAAREAQLPHGIGTAIKYVYTVPYTRLVPLRDGEIVFIARRRDLERLIL